MNGTGPAALFGCLPNTGKVGQVHMHNMPAWLVFNSKVGQVHMHNMPAWLVFNNLIPVLSDPVFLKESSKSIQL